jgi:hypothetical protein
MHAGSPGSRPGFGQFLEQFHTVISGDLVIDDHQRKTLLLRVGQTLTR